MQPKILCIGVSAAYVAVMVCPNVQFYTKCAVLILICALLTAHLSAGADCAPLSLLAGFWGGEEKAGKGKGRKVEGEKEEKRGEKMGKRQREEGGKEEKEREEFCAVVIFS